MNKNQSVIFYITFISVLVINITTLLKGIKQHETWLIVVGAIGMVLMAIPGMIRLPKLRKREISE